MIVKWLTCSLLMFVFSVANAKQNETKTVDPELATEQVFENQNILATFTTDGCSAFPNGTQNQQSLWLNCCIKHDLAYWQGGTKDQKRQADEDLKQCVVAQGEPEVGKLMLAGVKVGGTPFLPTPFRWGYGWKFGRGFEPLSENDQQQVNQQLEQFLNLINQFAIEVKQKQEIK